MPARINYLHSKLFLSFFLKKMQLYNGTLIVKIEAKCSLAPVFFSSHPFLSSLQTGLPVLRCPSRLVCRNKWFSWWVCCPGGSRRVDSKEGLEGCSVLLISVHHAHSCPIWLSIKHLLMQTVCDPILDVHTQNAYFKSCCLQFSRSHFQPNSLSYKFLSSYLHNHLD